MDELFTSVRRQLTPRYGEGEARAIAFLLFEEGFGVSRTSIYADKVNQFSQHERERLLTMCNELVAGVPVQQVLGSAWFCSRRFRVTPNVLIPRPETEELVAWAVQLASALAPSRARPLRLLDAGTGSGCIAISLYLELRQLGIPCEVEAWDVSDAALQVARGNAEALGAEVQFKKVDMLLAAQGNAENLDNEVRLNKVDSLQSASSAEDFSPTLPFDLIVSNPPYICERERAEMEQHVLEHEPALALFVPNDDPLRFYKALCRLAQQRLAPGGWLVVEGNAAYGEEMKRLFTESGLQGAELREDAFGRPRLLGATLAAPGGDASSRRRKQKR